MNEILSDIISQLRGDVEFDENQFTRIIRRAKKRLGGNDKDFSKQKLLPYYLKTKTSNPQIWATWNIDPELERRLMQLLQVKPRRTASGVATITVITKPWSCSSNCLYCPNDIRMPKSYLSDEPACQRAERNYFDPYLQVVSRLRALTQMGHITDKIELIVLGGTFSDYTPEYQIWFTAELFRALNDETDREKNAKKRRTFYKNAGLSNDCEVLLTSAAPLQEHVSNGKLTYNQAVQKLYEISESWQNVSETQIATLQELYIQHTINETTQHRVVGLCVEIRPDSVTTETLTLLRRLGCTKLQMGIQSLSPEILRMNHRNIDTNTIKQAFAHMRLFGFKVHTHFMVNLYGSTVQEDIAEYQRFVTETAYIPDEVKLYPCSLVAGTGLVQHYEDGTWQPYTEDELLDVLVSDVLNTPQHIRISRMIRDISAHDIVAGNKKANLRQMVEAKIVEQGGPIVEMRHREISGGEVDGESLSMKVHSYATTISTEYFLQWVTPEDKLAGFLRLSLPDSSSEAMIRELHVYGKVAQLSSQNNGARREAQKTLEESATDVDSTSQYSQHTGLGKHLIEAAAQLAREQGYSKLNIISSVGTRQYYRNLYFEDGDLYQYKVLH